MRDVVPFGKSCRDLDINAHRTSCERDSHKTTCVADIEMQASACFRMFMDTETRFPMRSTGDVHIERSNI